MIKFDNDTKYLLEAFDFGFDDAEAESNSEESEESFYTADTDYVTIPREKFIEYFDKYVSSNYIFEIPNNNYLHNCTILVHNTIKIDTKPDNELTYFINFLKDCKTSKIKFKQYNCDEISPSSLVFNFTALNNYTEELNPIGINIFNALIDLYGKISKHSCIKFFNFKVDKEIPAEISLDHCLTQCLIDLNNKTIKSFYNCKQLGYNNYFTLNGKKLNENEVNYKQIQELNDLIKNNNIPNPDIIYFDIFSNKHIINSIHTASDIEKLYYQNKHLNEQIYSSLFDNFVNYLSDTKILSFNLSETIKGEKEFTSTNNQFSGKYDSTYKDVKNLLKNSILNYAINLQNSNGDIIPLQYKSDTQIQITGKLIEEILAKTNSKFERNPNFSGLPDIYDEELKICIDCKTYKNDLSGNDIAKLKNDKILINLITECIILSALNTNSLKFKSPFKESWSSADFPRFYLNTIYACCYYSLHNDYVSIDNIFFATLAELIDFTHMSWQKLKSDRWSFTRVFPKKVLTNLEICDIVFSFIETNKADEDYQKIIKPKVLDYIDIIVNNSSTFFIEPLTQMEQNNINIKTRQLP